VVVGTRGVVANKGMIQCSEDNTLLVLSSHLQVCLQSVVVDRTPPERRKRSSPVEIHTGAARCSGVVSNSKGWVLVLGCLRRVRAKKPAGQIGFCVFSLSQDQRNRLYRT